MGRNYDFIAIGDTVTDAFIRLKDASVYCDLNRENCKICMKFADKIPYEETYVVPAVGNSANAAVAAARLGLKSALVSNLGSDYWGEQCLAALKKERVATEFVKVHRGRQTNYHYVLWYEDERTILIKHQPYRYQLPRGIASGFALAMTDEIASLRLAMTANSRLAMTNGIASSALARGRTRNDGKADGTGWIYLSSLGETADGFYKSLEHYLDKHPQVELAFQPGTFQIKMGRRRLAGIYKRTAAFFCNKQEAERILEKPGTDIRDLLKGIQALGPRIVVITDGVRGAYVYSDGQGEDGQILEMPIYPDPKPPYERTGAGDAFSSTFTAALALGKTVAEALRWAPVNSMSVVQKVGARAGLLSRSGLEKYLREAPKGYGARKMI